MYECGAPEHRELRKCTKAVLARHARGARRAISDKNLECRYGRQPPWDPHELSGTPSSGTAGPKRVTIPVLQVIDVFLYEPRRDDWFALEICRRTSLGSGTVAQILFRLEQWGWLTSRWEDATEAHSRGRPRRRFYQLTGLGATEAQRLVRQRFPGIQRWASTGELA